MLRHACRCWICRSGPGEGWPVRARSVRCETLRLGEFAGGRRRVGHLEHPADRRADQRHGVIVATVSSGGVESGPASSPRARLHAHLEDLVRPGRGAQPLTPVHQHDQSRSSWAGGLVVGAATRGQRRPVEQGSHRQLCSGRAALRYRRRADGTARPPVVRQRRAVARSLHANAPVRHLCGSGPGAPPRPFAEAFTRPRCFACIRIGTLRLW